MKKLSYIMLLILLIYPVKSKALNNEVLITCDKDKLLPGEEVKCKVEGNTAYEVSGLDFSLEGSSNLILSNFKKDAVWDNGEISNNDIKILDNGKTIARIALYTGSNKKNKFPIVSFNVKAKNINSGDDALISLTGTKDNEANFSDGDFESHKLEINPYKIRIMSNENKLDSLKIDGKVVDGFNKDKNDYTIEVKSSIKSIKIEGISKDENIKIDGNGTKELKYGTNTFNINVTSESGKVNTYKVNVNRIDDRSPYKDLTNFKFINYDLKFDCDTTKYNIEVINKINKLVLAKESIDNDSFLIIDNSFKFSDKTSNIIKYNDKVININDIGDNKYLELGDIKEGNNKLSITVTAENETIKEYTFIINRLDKSGNNIEKNPTTGNFKYIFIISILIISGISSVILYKKKVNNI